MQKLILRRIAQYNDCTYGILMDTKKPSIICVTLEPPWKHNQKNKSCIPAGEYLCSKIEHITDHGKHTYLVNNVKNRDSIIIHTGNRGKDTKGCILLGTTFGSCYNEHWIYNSALAFGKFIERLQGINEFKLKIETCF